jgi:hypothetical protein
MKNTDKPINKLKDILFIDIETVSGEAMLENVTPVLQKAWEKKSTFLGSSEQQESMSAADWYAQRASLYAEYGKIISIGVAYFYANENDELCLRSKAFTSNDEATVLGQFVMLLGQKRFDPRTMALCAHNGREFDFPYLCRRMMVNKIPIPNILYSQQRKPWESPLLDTMEMWRFGERKSYVSLQVLAALLGIENTLPSDIEHTSMSKVFYEEANAVERIADFSRRDVALTAQVYLHLSGHDDLIPQNIFYVD